MRVPFEAIEHEDYTDARHGGRPFTGTAFDLRDGALVEKVEFVRGQLHGWRREFYASGRPRWEASYRDGVPDGRGTRYYEDGRVESVAESAAGVTLEWREFTRDGVMVAEYCRDTGVLSEWRADGSLRKRTTSALPGGLDRREVVEGRFFDHAGTPTVIRRDGAWRTAGDRRDGGPRIGPRRAAWAAAPSDPAQ